ncbi:MORN repeat-containing protein [Tepidibacter sp. Z1-5]|uniref:MORN repeat-containing protein n=1 Tax=Tepidibacter sp. Z1-5 TaxID=3134138 RepID=UPI0030BC01B9
MENENKRKGLNDKGLWSPNAIMIIGSVFSFFIAGIMSAINYGRLGYIQKKRRDIYSIVLALAACLFLINISDEKITSGMIVVAINVAMSLYYKANQEKIYKEHMRNNGKRGSLKIPILSSIIVILILLGIGYRTDYLYLKITGRYEGDIYNGIGKIYDKNSNIKYEGDFRHGKPDGNGKLYHGNESLAYEGDFKDGKFDGNGKMYYENGNLKYEGDFKDSDYHGQGKLYYKNGNLAYNGDFKDGLTYGQGKWYNENGNLRYEGSLKNDLAHGQGKLYDENGNLIFEGELIDGEPVNGKAYDKTGNLIKEGNVKGMFD